MSALARWPVDPRISSAFTRLVEQPPFLHKSSLPMWNVLQAELTRYADPRTKERLAAVAALGQGWVTLFSPTMREPISAWLTQTRGELGQAIEQCRTRQLTRDERASLAGLVRKPMRQVALEAVWANPDNLSARLVYADMLSSEGDPRGEFIALQCQETQTAATKRRACVLLARADQSWAGPLAPFVQVRAWERGFPAVVTVECAAARQLSRVLGHPAWSTIHTIQLTPVGVGRTPLQVITHPAMKRVERVMGLTAGDVRALAKLNRPLPFRSLVIRDDLSLLRTLTRERYPSLTSVYLQGRVTPLHHEAMAGRPEVVVGAAGFSVSEWPAEQLRNESPAVSEPAGASSKLNELASVSVGAVLRDRGQPVRITDILELGTQSFGASVEAWDPDEMEQVRFGFEMPPGRARVYAAMSKDRARLLKLVFSSAKVAWWRKVGRLPRSSELLIFSAAGTFQEIDSFVDDAEELIRFRKDILDRAFGRDEGAALVDVKLGTEKYPSLVWRQAWFGGTVFAGETSRGKIAALLIDGLRGEARPRASSRR